MLVIEPHSMLSGTGHRPDKIGAQESGIRAAIRVRLVQYAPNLAGVISGMALGFDTWLAEETLNLGLKLVCAVPFPGQESVWPRPELRENYRRILARAAIVHYCRNQRPRDRSQAASWLFERDEWMVKHSHAVLACYNGDPRGGTAHTFRYARTQRVPVDRIHPLEPWREDLYR